MLGAALVALSAIAGVALFATGQGIRAAWVAIQTGLILGTILFVAGLIGELIAGTRAQLRELRRQVTELHNDR
jgi:hypothetical protein